MSSRLRDYQNKSRLEVYDAWRAKLPNVLLTSATGAGKTVLYSAILQECNTPAVLVAHRSELVSQSALALNRERVPHSIIAPKATISEIVRLEHDTHGYSDFAWRAPIRVAGVDTLIRLDPAVEKWLGQVGLLVIDEGHHVLRENKWGKAYAMMPQATVLGVTAHAIRADGKGLGRSADGIFDTIVTGPHARELINRGFLTDYRVLIPPNDIDFSDVKIGSTGDYSINQLRAATHKSKLLVGDVVKTYVREAGGKLGLTFAVDIESANELCRAYRAAQVPAEIITGNTSVPARSTIMRAFRERRILQLISVDVLGEGTDVPAVEVVSLARRTASWQLMCQQIGRALRVSVGDEYSNGWSGYSDDERRAVIGASAKPKALILDHVGNILFHYKKRGFPDSRQEYFLSGKDVRERDGIPLRTCLVCFQPYEAFYNACPHCGTPKPPPSSRGTPREVEGVLRELDPETLAKLRGEVLRVDAPVRLPQGVDKVTAKAITRNHNDRASAQKSLREHMAMWGGYWNQMGFDDDQTQRLFFYVYGVDVLTAQAMSAQDAAQFEFKVRAELRKLNVQGYI